MRPHNRDRSFSRNDFDRNAGRCPPTGFFNQILYFHRHGRRGFGPGRFGGRHGMHDDEHLGGLRRLLAHGDLRMVVLLLIEEKPRHGYELIKLIESKSSGQYAPSPGVIYPTLTYLEETGHVKTTLIDDKKQYAITDEGTVFLNENRETATAIVKRLEEMGARMAEFRAKAEGDPFPRDDRSEIRDLFHEIKYELRSRFRAGNRKEILQILKRTLEDIKNLGQE